MSNCIVNDVGQGIYDDICRISIVIFKGKFQFVIIAQHFFIGSYWVTGPTPGEKVKEPLSESFKSQLAG